MAIDLRHLLNEGMNYLVTWRNRYSKSEYPEKVVMNIFYRKYTMEFMFPDIIGCFDTNLLGKSKLKWNDFSEGLQVLRSKYGSTAASKTHPVLLNLLSNTQRNVGNTNYGIFIPLISDAKDGSIAKLEEIEYAYLYYLLTDECILLWGALGGTGLTQIEAIGTISGFLIKAEEIETYGQIEKLLGHLCAAAYLKEHYKELPPNV